MSDEITLDDLPQPVEDGPVPPDELEADGDNPNEMTDEQFGLLCDRMRQNGWLGGPIITNTDGLIADGEHRWRAAQEIGLAEVPVRQYDIEDATRRLWRQELNKIHGEHDSKRDALEYDLLLDAGHSEEVTELTDAVDEDLDELLAEIRMDRSAGPAYEYDPEHNVHFEDCVEGMRERLDENSIDLVLTDPPYGVSAITEGGTVGKRAESIQEGEHREYEKFEGDDEFDFAPVWAQLTRVSERYVVFGGDIFMGEVLPHTNSWIVWDKRAGAKSFLSDCELAWTNLGIYPTIYEYTWQGFIREGGEKREDHPTQKPVELFSQIIKDHTEPGDVVLDPFMGSGTTAVAAIQNDRDYIGFEIDEENYRDVIERRIGEAKRQREAGVNQAEADAND